MGKAVLLKSSLYSSLVKGIISAEDYSEMNAAYSAEIIELEKRVKALSSEVQGITAHKNQQLKWLKAICRTVEIKGFDRTGIVQLVRGILVKSKIDVEVQFQFEIT